PGARAGDARQPRGVAVRDWIGIRSRRGNLCRRRDRGAAHRCAVRGWRTLSQTYLTWLGQAGFLIEAPAARILLDPFLSEHPARLYPPPRYESLATGIDWLLVTHEHLDHLDLDFVPVLAKRSPELRVVLPAPLSRLLDGHIEPDRISGVAPGDSLELAGGVV